jgi:hypothetical protein
LWLEYWPGTRVILVLHPLYKIPVKKLLGVGLSLEMIKKIGTEDAVSSLEKYENKILLLFGDNDELTKSIRFQLISKGIINKSNIDYVIIKNADHLFSRGTYINKVFDVTTNWLICNFSGKSKKGNEKY